ncbi:hydroxyacylglutathione hydrolase [Sphingomonas sp.]|uniref:hydroxyacylglutathione hydrolase n=1 Tax=Sphingomonas sp. TaxID=28214 RepID=UPI002FCABE42
MVEIARVPVLNDNYVWLIHDEASGETAAIDPAVGQPVLDAAAARGWRITQIWNTHWHPDHIGGNAEIKAATGCKITAPAAEAGKIPTLERAVSEGDKVSLGGIEAEVFEVPAHTAGHIAYHLPSEKVVFVGDTLFAMGCGKLFEGTAEQMYGNMKRLEALPADTKVYCAHEYTLANARFAITVEPDNQDLQRRFAEVVAAREAGEATVPTDIGLERATNPFMRASSIAELAERRAAKDSFRG